jgi:hypothetical protein
MKTATAPAPMPAAPTKAQNQRAHVSILTASRRAADREGLTGSSAMRGSYG